MLEDDLSVTLMRLGLATLLGLVLGFERERHGHDAGLRTHGLVALSSGRNMTTAASLWMAAAVGITAGAGQYILVLAGTALAVLLLVAATFVERMLPKNGGSPDSQKSVQMPNRRGSVVPSPPPGQLGEEEK